MGSTTSKNISMINWNKQLMEYDVIIFDYDDTLMSSKITMLDAQRQKYIGDIFYFFKMLQRNGVIVVIDSHGLNFYNDFLNETYGKYCQSVIDNNVDNIDTNKILYLPLFKRDISGNKIQNSLCGKKPRRRNSKFDDIHIILNSLKKHISRQSNILFVDDIEWILCNAYHNIVKDYPSFKTYKIELNNNPTLMRCLNIKIDTNLSDYECYKYNKQQYILLLN